MRVFKLTALAALTALATGVAQAGSSAPDVIVVGAGGTGMAAAASAAENGARVLVLEKLGMIGGSSAFAGGAIAAGSSNAQQRAGLTETTPEAFANIWLNDQKRSVPGGNPKYPDTDKVRRVTEEFTVTVNWLEDKVGHQFAKPRPFGYGGPAFAHAPAEAPIPASGRGSSPQGGKYVIQSLKRYTDKLGVEIRTGTAVRSLLTENGAVTGVVACKKDDCVRIPAKAVVLAAGGFPHNREMMEKYAPAFAPFVDDSVASVGDAGDGIRMATEVGAVPYEDAWIIGLYVNSPRPGLQKTFTSKDKYKDRVFVNDKGVRFVNENLPYLTEAIGLEKTAWAIVDSADKEKASILAGVNDRTLVAVGNTWKALAANMGVEPAALVRTMTDYNRACETGEDLTFKKPKQFLKPFVTAPFYAVRVVPQTGGTLGGVKTDDSFRVLDKNGRPIPGLYAGGEMTNRAYYGRVYTSGTGLGLAYTSGRIAGAAAAKEAAAK